MLIQIDIYFIVKTFTKIRILIKNKKGEGEWDIGICIGEIFAKLELLVQI